MFVVTKILANSSNNELSIFNKETVKFLIYAFSLAMLFCIIGSALLKKYQKEQYQGISFTTKNISYMTMLITSSVVLTIIVSILIPFTVFPPIRIAIEGLMIKITGYMFGPIFGVISASITDLLVLLHVPSYINYVYIFGVVLTGFVAGVVGVMRKRLANHLWVFFFLINAFLISFSVFIIYKIYLHQGNTIKISENWSPNKYFISTIIIVNMIIILLIFYLTLFILWKKAKNKIIKDILPIIFLVVFSEIMITSMIVAYADMQLFTSTSIKDAEYGTFFLLRFLMAPIKVVANTMVIYITFRVVSPLIYIDKNRKSA